MTVFGFAAQTNFSNTCLCCDGVALRAVCVVVVLVAVIVVLVVVIAVLVVAIVVLAAVIAILNRSDWSEAVAY